VILKWLLKFNKINKVLVHSEFCITGGIKNLVLLLPFFGLIKITGKRLTFFAHNVVESFDSLAPHFNLKRRSLKLLILNFGLKFYNRLLGLVVDKIVVLDKAIEKRLKNFLSLRKITLAPIWVGKAENKISKIKERKKLGIKPKEKVILYFGFVTWYKGADWIVNNFKKQTLKSKHDEIKLILAGGRAYSLKEKPYYQKFYKQLVDLGKVSGKIEITGFVPEKEIATYFAAADLVVLPYRGLIGASGVLNHALTFKKPFLVSNKMIEILENRETKKILDQLRMGRGEVTFDLNRGGFKKISRVLENKKQLAKLENFSALLAKERNVERRIEQEYSEIYASEEKVVPSLALPVFDLRRV
jgi:glycosyltransferase involved in cell wall biosynthesis